LEKINKIDKPLAKVTKTKRKRTRINRIEMRKETSQQTPKKSRGSSRSI
jgi:hypothetical protein